MKKGITKLFSTLLAPLSKEKKTRKSIEKSHFKEERPIGSQIRDSKAKASEIILAAKNEALETKRRAEKEASRIREQAFEIEKKLEAQKAILRERTHALEKKEREAQSLRETYLKKLDEIEEIKRKQVEKLEKAGNLTRKEAEKVILDHVESQLSKQISKRVRQAKEEIESKSDELAREVLVDAMQKASTDYVAEYTVSKVKIPDEDMKGRIIGKEGRNIRAFEELTGVNLDLDETPNEVRVSCFDSVRREIAKVSLERLVSDGRIHPARIEEIVAKTKKEIEKIMYKAGEDLVNKVGVYGLPKELIALLGRFKYRFSYGQNMLEHTLEEVRIGTYIAREVGADVQLTKLACLLHDIGKAVSEDQEGTHIELGVQILKKHKMPSKVIQAVAEHHGDEFSSVESVILQIADNISGSRPGARYGDYSEYVKRMRSLEETALKFKGVDKAYAISAGRELRVIVKPDKVSDDEVAKLAFDIASRVEKDHKYPGTVKINVIRDYRVSEFAK